MAINQASKRKGNFACVHVRCLRKREWEQEAPQNTLPCQATSGGTGLVEKVHDNDIKDQGKGNNMLEKSKGMRIQYG
jgi:hypothetical protein